MAEPRRMDVGLALYAVALVGPELPERYLPIGVVSDDRRVGALDPLPVQPELLATERTVRVPADEGGAVLAVEMAIYSILLGPELTRAFVELDGRRSVGSMQVPVDVVLLGRLAACLLYTSPSPRDRG